MNKAPIYDAGTRRFYLEMISNGLLQVQESLVGNSHGLPSFPPAATSKRPVELAPFSVLPFTACRLKSPKSSRKLGSKIPNICYGSVRTPISACLVYAEVLFKDRPDKYDGSADLRSSR